MKNYKKLVILSALLLVACGGPTGTSSSSSAGSSSAEPSVSQSSEAPGSSETSSSENQTSSESSNDPVSSESSSEDPVTSDTSSEGPVSSESSSDAPASSESSSEESSSSEAPAQKFVVNSFTDLMDGSFDFSIAEGDEFEAGELVVQADYTYYDTLDEDMISSLYLHINDDVYRARFAPGETSGMTVYFDVNMPSENVDIYFIENSGARESATGYTVTFDSPLPVLGYVPNVKYDLSYFRATILKLSGWMIESIQYRYEGEESWTTSEDWYSYDGVVTLNLYDMTNNVEIKVNAIEVGSKTITYVNGDKVEGLYGDVLHTEMTPGEEYDLYYGALDGYFITGAAILTGVPEENISYNNEYGSLTFTMPNNDITIEFSVGEKAEITFAANDLLTSVVASSSYTYEEPITTAGPEETFYVLATPVDGYVVKGASINGGEMVNVQTYTSYSGYTCDYVRLTMPATGDAEVTVYLDQGLTVSFEQKEGATLSTGKTTYAPGATVTVNITRDSVLTIVDSVEVKDNADVVVTLEQDWSGNYTATFTMPETDVVLVPTYSFLEGKTITVEADPEMVGFNIQGESGASISEYDEVYTETFVVGEELMFNLRTASNKYGVESVTLKDASGNEIATYETFVNDWGEIELDDFVFVPDVEGDVTIVINAIEYEPIAFNLNDNGLEGYTLKIRDNYWTEWTVEQIANGEVEFYPNDMFTVLLSGEASEGKVLMASVTDAEGEVLGQARGMYIVPTDSVNIEIKEVGFATVTYTVPDGVMGSIQDPSTYSSIENGAQVAEGTNLATYFYSYNSPFGVTIKVDGEVVYSGEAVYEWGSYVVEYQFAATGDVEITFKTYVTVYAKLEESTPWSSVYVYAWNDNGDNAWPGQEMTYDEYTGLYSAHLEEGYQHLIFDNGNGGTGNQTPDLSFYEGVDTYILSNNGSSVKYGYNYYGEVQLVGIDPKLFVCGDMNSWGTPEEAAVAYDNATDTAKVTFTVTAGQTFKISNEDWSIQFNAANSTLCDGLVSDGTSNNNIKCTVAGTYTVTITGIAEGNIACVFTVGAEESTLAGTYTDGTNTVVLNADGTGTWNENSITWDTETGKIAPFAAFDGDSNQITVNEDGTLTIYVGDTYYENCYTGTFTKVN